MKALVYGNENIYKALESFLTNEGIEMQKLEDDFHSTGGNQGESNYDLAIVNSQSDNANKACRYIRENWDIPLVLIVDTVQADWKKLKPIEADGYIPEVKKDRELSARARAILRRLILRNKFQERKSGEPELTLKSEGRASPV